MTINSESWDDPHTKSASRASAGATRMPSAVWKSFVPVAETCQAGQSGKRVRK